MQDDAMPPAAGGGNAANPPAGHDNLDRILPVLAALPLPLLVRRPCGAVEFANDAARAELGMAASDLASLSTTRFGRGGARGNVYLLNQGMVALRRFHARAVPLPGGEPRELLVVREAADAAPEADAGPRRKIAPRRRVPAPLFESSLRALDGRVHALRTTLNHLQAAEPLPDRVDVLPPTTARELAAALARRLRRHASAASPLRLDIDLDRTPRRLDADATRLASVLLNGIELLKTGAPTATPSALTFQAGLSGCRLRLAIDVAGLEGAPDLPDIFDRQDLVDELLPIVRAHRGTFEVHQGSVQRASAKAAPAARRPRVRRIVFTLPLAPRKPRP